MRKRESERKLMWKRDKDTRSIKRITLSSLQWGWWDIWPVTWVWPQACCWRRRSWGRDRRLTSPSPLCSPPLPHRPPNTRSFGTSGRERYRNKFVLSNITEHWTRRLFIHIFRPLVRKDRQTGNTTNINTTSTPTAATTAKMSDICTTNIHSQQYHQQQYSSKKKENKRKQNSTEQQQH